MNNWDDVRYFLEVARHGNVTSAARALGVNHSTVSRRIKALEGRQGVRLFDRIPSGYELTEDASEIYELATQIESLNQAFDRKLQGQDSRLQGRVTITMPHDIFEFFFAQQLPDFKKLYPEITFDLFVAKGLKNLSAREADIAVRLTASPPDYLIGKKLCSLHYGLYRPIALERLDEAPIITWSSEDTPPAWAKEHLINPKVALQVDDLFSMYRAVEAGLGFARMPVYMHNMYRSMYVEKVPAMLPVSDWGLWLLSHADLRKTTRVQVCRQFLLEQFEQNINLFIDTLE